LAGSGQEGLRKKPGISYGSSEWSVKTMSRNATWGHNSPYRAQSIRVVNPHCSAICTVACLSKSEMASTVDPLSRGRRWGLGSFTLTGRVGPCHPEFIRTGNIPRSSVAGPATSASSCNSARCVSGSSFSSRPLAIMVRLIASAVHSPYFDTVSLQSRRKEGHADSNRPLPPAGLPPCPRACGLLRGRLFAERRLKVAEDEAALRPPRTISESRCAGVRRVDSGRRDSGSRRTLVSRMA